MRSRSASDTTPAADAAPTADAAVLMLSNDGGSVRVEARPVDGVAVALAIILNFYNNHATVDVDKADELKG